MKEHTKCQSGKKKLAEIRNTMRCVGRVYNSRHDNIKGRRLFFEKNVVHVP